MGHIGKHKIFYVLVVIFCFYVLLSFPHLINNNFWAPDADRIAMDGIFLLDFIKDMPGSLLRIYTYTTEYYAQYPALSIGYRPVFFPLIEAFFYALFGLSHLSARMAVFFFLFAGMFFWFRLGRETHNTALALLSLLLWRTNPRVYEYSQQTMLEIPTLAMCIIGVYYLYKYEIMPSVRHGVILGLVVGFTLWTNQKSGFILPLLCLYPIVKKHQKLLFARNTWIVAVIILTFLIPLACITLWLGDENLEQSLGIQTNSELAPVITANFNWFSKWFFKLEPFKNISYIYYYHFSAPVLALILVGMFFSLIRKDSRCLIFVTGIVCVYLFFTIIRAKIPRYPMYWIPFFCVFAAIGLQTLNCSLKKLFKTRNTYITYAIYSLPIILQLCSLPNVFVGYAAGYEEAAQYVLQRTVSPVIFFEGYANGQFIFFARVHDPERQFVILRGDKLISSSSLYYKHKLQIHLQSKEEIHQAFSDLSVQFVVVESVDKSGIDIYTELRDLLRDPARFTLHNVIHVESNINSLKGQDLLVYESLGYKELTHDQILHLRLPLVGKTIDVKLKKILR